MIVDKIEFQLMDNTVEHFEDVAVGNEIISQDEELGINAEITRENDFVIVKIPIRQYLNEEDI